MLIYADNLFAIALLFLAGSIRRVSIYTVGTANSQREPVRRVFR